MALLLRNVRCVVSCDENDTVYEKVDVFCEDGVIKGIGKDLDVAAERVINCTDYLCYPGLVNTHHHMYQLFSRNLPEVQGMKLFDWLTALYDKWKNLTPELIHLSSKCALALLAKSGCTTAFDHHYVFPKEHSIDFLEAQFAAADEIVVADGEQAVALELGDDGVEDGVFIESGAADEQLGVKNVIHGTQLLCSFLHSV